MPRDRPHHERCSIGDNLPANGHAIGDRSGFVERNVNATLIIADRRTFDEGQDCRVYPEVETNQRMITHIKCKGRLDGDSERV